MKKLDFNPSKSTDDFRKNYKLHDIAEYNGKNLLTQWGFKCTEFGEDNRYKKVWEKGEDKPDTIISYNDRSALLDWKGKHGSTWLVNERAISPCVKRNMIHYTHALCQPKMKYHCSSSNNQTSIRSARL